MAHEYPVSQKMQQHLTDTRTQKQKKEPDSEPSNWLANRDYPPAKPANQ